MSDEIEFYVKKLRAEEDGLAVWTDKWVSVHETPCFHFCVKKSEIIFVRSAAKYAKETLRVAAKRLKRLKKIAKQNSRFAFGTEEAALDHLRYLKKRQLMHMERETKFIQAFLDCKDIEPVKVPGHRRQLVPDTEDLVREHLLFD